MSLKIGDIVTLDLPDNTIKPYKKLNIGVRLGGLTYPSGQIARFTNKDQFEIINPAFYGCNDNEYVLRPINTNNVIKVHKDDIVTNDKLIRQRLGVK